MALKRPRDLTVLALFKVNYGPLPKSLLLGRPHPSACNRLLQGHPGSHLGESGHPAMAIQTQLIHPETDRRTRSARARRHYPGPSRLYLAAPPHSLQGAGRKAGPGLRPPASRRRAEVTHARSRFRRAETRKKLGAAEASGPLSPVLPCPVARAAPSCREPRPWGSPGRPQCEAWGLLRAPRTGQGRAGGRRRSSCGPGRRRPPGLPAS